ncbi:MAG: hypothetical protein JXM73_24285 [Anaerolineae bacterium]|nr:hypothetical protein [Anaerolineae bacterium]
MTGQVPPPIKKQGTLAISTLDLREVIILAIFFGLAVALVFSAPGDLAVRIFFGTLVAGTGLALAFTTLQGEKLETWLYRTLAFQLSGRKLSVWRRGDAVTPRPVQFEEEQPQAEQAPPAPPRFRRPVLPELAGDLSFLVTLANVVIFAIFAALTAYVATGGAQQVIDYARYLFGA